jgi:release factor glutamine methyltransferase
VSGDDVSLDGALDDEVMVDTADGEVEDLTGTVSWRELLAEATARFRSAGLEHGASDARRVVEQASGASPSELLLVLDELVTERGMAHFDDMVQRRIGGEPLQYVLGAWSFRTLDLMVDSRVLIPRPETEAVVEVALAELDALGARQVPTTVVDLGTGSGAIALAIAAERVRTTVWATDLSDEALVVARANIAGLGRSGARVHTGVGSWFEALPDELRGSVDLLISNPPYVATSALLPEDVTEWEPGLALWSGPDGTDDLRTIVSGAGEWLRDGGVLVCELSPEQADAMEAFAAEHFVEVRVEPDLAGRPRALVARGPRR